MQSLNTNMIKEQAGFKVYSLSDYKTGALNHCNTFLYFMNHCV